MNVKIYEHVLHECCIDDYDVYYMRMILTFMYAKYMEVYELFLT